MDQNDPVDMFEYHAHIMSPDDSDKHLGDTLNIEVHFESHTGEPIHNINVEIMKDSDSSIVYSKPHHSHIHEEDGVYHYTDQIVLNDSNGFTGHSNWTLTAKVWGMAEGEGEASETLNFHVHP